MHIDVQDLEEILAEATLHKYGNNVHTLTKSMEKTWKEIKRLKHKTYDDCRFLTQLFRAMLTTTNEDFERAVKNLKDAWIRGDNAISVTYVVEVANNSYRNIKGERSWNKKSDKDAKIIALTTKVGNLEQKLTNPQGNGGGGNGSNTDGSTKAKLRVDAWRIKNVGNTTEHDGKKWVWCKHHKSDGLFEGMYMPEGHDHDAWKKDKKERVASYKERRGKRDKDSSGGGSTPSKLTLSKSLQAALATNLGLSDADATSMAEKCLEESSSN